MSRATMSLVPSKKITNYKSAWGEYELREKN